MAQDISATSANRAISKSYDETTESLKTTITNADININVSAFTDSIAIAGVNGLKVTTTTVGAKQSLDVNVLDLTLDAANDSVAIKNGANQLAINADGSINVVGGTGTTGLTNSELRLSPVPISALSLPLPLHSVKKVKRLLNEF